MEPDELSSALAVVMSAYSLGQLFGYALWALLVAVAVREVIRRVCS